MNSFGLFQEHPYLGVPFYQLHPCHTADVMKRASSVSEDKESHRYEIEYYNKLFLFLLNPLALVPYLTAHDEC